MRGKKYRARASCVKTMASEQIRNFKLWLNVISVQLKHSIKIVGWWNLGWSMSLLCAVLKDVQQNLDLGEIFSEMGLQTAPVQNWAVERQSRKNSRWKSFFPLFVFLFIYLFYLWEGNTKLATSDAWRKVFCHLNFTNLELRGLLLLLSLCSQDILCSNYRFLISAQELQNEILWLLSGRMLLQFTVERRRGLKM